MNKRLFFISIGVIAMTIIAGCQKDDLCPPDIAATPRLIVVFKNQSNPLLTKTVNNLRVREVGQTDFAPLNRVGATTLTAVDSIAIPLKFDNAGTVYEFIRTDEDGIENTDTVTISYELGEEYVNRACGFKVIYNNVNSTINPEVPLNRWIQSTLVLQNNIIENNAAHVEIRH